MRTTGVLTAVLLLMNCHRLPTEPAEASTELRVTCIPAGIDVQCTATSFGRSAAEPFRDVTSEATWRASDPGLGSFTRPGIFVPTTRGEVTLWAEYRGLQAEVKPSFLVSPGGAAQRLYFISGLVRDATSNSPLSGATVRVVVGYAAGKSATTNSAGWYEIEPVLTGETFSITASREGYAPSSTSYRVDSPIGSGGGNPPFLDFALVPAP